MSSASSGPGIKSQPQSGAQEHLLRADEVLALLDLGYPSPHWSAKASLQRTETNQQVPRSPTPPETRARLTRAQIRLLVGCGASNLPHWP